MSGIFNVEYQYKRLIEPILAQTNIRFEMFHHKRRDCLQIIVDDKDVEAMAILLVKHRTTI